MFSPIEDFFHAFAYSILTTRSYGSVTAAHLLHHPWIKQKIGPVLFIDPVSFLLHLPDVAYNFVLSSYRLIKMVRPASLFLF
jgi:hypothetical protein